MVFGSKYNGGNYTTEERVAMIKGANDEWKNSGGGNLQFYTSSAGYANRLHERMRIDKSGNIGIGTSSPAARLHVESTNRTDSINRRCHWGTIWAGHFKGNANHDWNGDEILDGRDYNVLDGIDNNDYLEDNECVVFGASTENDAGAEIGDGEFWVDTDLDRTIDSWEIITGATTNDTTSSSGVIICPAGDVWLDQNSDGIVDAYECITPLVDAENTPAISRVDFTGESCPTGTQKRDENDDGNTDDGECHIPALFVQPNGNVGIGTTSPGYELEVEGQVASDALAIGAYEKFNAGQVFANASIPRERPIATFAVNEYHWSWTSGFFVEAYSTYYESGYVRYYIDASRVGTEVIKVDSRGDLDGYFGLRLEKDDGNNLATYGTNKSCTAGDSGQTDSNGDKKYHCKNYLYTLYGQAHSSTKWNVLLESAGINVFYGDATATGQLGVKKEEETEYTDLAGLDSIENNDGISLGRNGVGIGTASPKADLDASDVLVGYPSIMSRGKNDDELDFAVPSTESIQFGHHDGTSNGGTTQLFIDTSGNVGIGTTSPDAKLEVARQDSLGDIAHFAGNRTNGAAWVTFQNNASQDQHVFGIGVDNNERLNFSPMGAMGIVMDKNGNVGIGYSGHSHKLYVAGVAGGQSDWRIDSDSRLKTAVTTIPSALEKILSLRGVTFEWKQEEFPERNFADGTQIGLIAQEVEAVFPELVSQGEYKAVSYASLVSPLIEAIKELHALYQGHADRLAALEAQNAELETQNAHQDERIAHQDELIVQLEVRLAALEAAQ